MSPALTARVPAPTPAVGPTTAAGGLVLLAWLLALVLMTSSFIYLSTVIPTWIEGRVTERTPAPLSILREVATALLYGACAVVLVLRGGRVPLPGTTVVGLLATAAVVVASVVTLVLKELPLNLAVAGLRSLQFLPAGIICYWLAREAVMAGRPATGPPPTLAIFGLAVRVLLVIQVAFALPQIRTMEPVFGQTVFGSRPFGTMPLPHHLGMLLGLLTLFFYVEKAPRGSWWAIACLALSLTTGSRLGMLLALGVITWWGIDRLRQPLIRPLAVLILPVLALAAYVAVSDESISGRVNVGESSNERAEQFRFAVQRLVEDPWHLLFGWGLGLASTGGWLMAEGGLVPLSILQITDVGMVSIVVHFGLPGLVLYLSVLATIAWYGDRRTAPPVVVVTLFMSASFVIWDLFPLNLILAVLLGWVAVPSPPSSQGTLS